MIITRRLFLRNTAAAGAVGATIAAPAVAEPAQPLSPDERIEAAIEEIKAAMWEKWPNAPLNITDCDNGDTGMVIIVTHLGDDEPGMVRHRRIGTARMGGAS